MHSTKKGNNYYFGEKVHIGVDAGTGYIHSVTTTAANVHDICETHNLTREDDEVIYGDSGYIGVEKREEMKDSAKKIKFEIVKRPSQIKEKVFPKDENNGLIVEELHLVNHEKQIESRKSSVRCKVEYPFYILKCVFGHKKAKYKGIKKTKAKTSYCSDW
jgi:IS5 family transposase